MAKFKNSTNYKVSSPGRKYKLYKMFWNSLSPVEKEEVYQWWMGKQDVKTVISHTLPPKDFYLSKEWKAFRYKFLKTIHDYNRICAICKKNGTGLHVDHIKPRWLYPELAFNFNNMQLLCEECNFAKSGDIPISNTAIQKVIVRRANSIINL